ncbi:MAG: hypothetical protein ACOCVE_05345, partial [Desulfovermiculus sp.]
MPPFPFPLSSPLELSGYEKHISFVFHPGMLFDSDCKWWPPGGKRISRHEGLDLCLVKSPGQEPESVPAGSRVVVPAPGRVVNIIPDFLGHSILVSHGLEPGGNREWISLLAHISPNPAIQIGQDVIPEQTAGWTKIFSRPRGMVSHLHLSFGLLQTPESYDLTWPELTKRDRL